MKFTEENIRFRVVYTISDYWDFPEINGEEFEWNGNTQVEQTMSGVLNARQFLWLIFDRELSESINTQGMQTESGFIIPAVAFYDPDENTQCYVSVYTDEMMELAVAQSQKPAPAPVLQKDFSVKSEILSFVEASKNWQKLVDALPEVVNSLEQEENTYFINNDKLDRIVPELLKNLNELDTNKQGEAALGACPDCNGLGHINGEECEFCQGEGKMPNEEKERTDQ